MKRLVLAVSLLTASLAAAQTSEVTLTEEPGRIRWGLDAKGGLLVSPSAGLFGLEGRVGYQLSRGFGLAANVGFNLGFGSSASSVSVISMGHLSVLAEGTIADRVTIGFGPTLGVGAWGGGYTFAKGTGVVAAGGFMPGGDLRVTFNFGKREAGTGRRSGFSLGLDLLALVSINSTVTITDNGKSETSKVPLLGIVPTLTLGYDAL